MMPPGAPEGGRSMLGNLDVEGELAAWRARERGDALPRALPVRLRETLAAFSTLLRVFARKGDCLSTIAPVDPSRLPRSASLVVPRLRVASSPAEIAEGPVLAWSRVRWSRSRGAATSPVARGRNGGAAAGPFGSFWRSPALAPAIVFAANHKGFCLRMRSELGVALSGECEVTSLSALETHLLGCAREAARWIVKAPLSAAGRRRVHGRGPHLRTSELGGAAALLAEQGSVVFEPWMERELDVGCAGCLDETGIHVLGVHRLTVDGGGRFRSVIVGGKDRAGLSPAEGATLRSALEHVGERLRSSGYTGPLALDAWRYRSPGLGERFQPLGEINARLTFGHLAHAYRRHLVESGELEPGGELELHLRAHPAATPPESTASRRVWTLLEPTRDGRGPGTAWLESVTARA